MSICDGCIHDYVCGLEDNHEEGIVSCADRIPKDVLDKIRAEIEAYQSDAFYSDDVMMNKRTVLEIINKYKAESERRNE